MRKCSGVRHLKFETVPAVSTAAAVALTTLPSGGNDAFECGFASAGLDDVLAPSLRAVGAALVVAV